MIKQVKHSSALQRERTDNVDTKLEKLGEEIALDINKIHKMATRSTRDLGQLRQDHAEATHLLAEAGAQLQRDIPNSKTAASSLKLS